MSVCIFWITALVEKVETVTIVYTMFMNVLGMREGIVSFQRIC